MFNVDRGGSMTVFGSKGYGSCGKLCAGKNVAIVTTNRDGTLRTQDKEVIAANGRDKVISRDRDGNGTFEIVENLTVTINPDTTRTNVLNMRNSECTKRTITNFAHSADALVKTVLNDSCLPMEVTT